MLGLAVAKNYALLATLLKLFIHLLARRLFS